MKRLLLISHAAELSGAEFVLLDIARYYGPACHVLLFADGPLATQLAVDGIQYTVLPAGSAISTVRREAGKLRVIAAMPAVIRFAYQVAKIARRYDVLYPNSQKAALITMLVASIIKRPVIWHLHDILNTEHFAPLQCRIMTYLANRHAKRVIVVSEAARASFIASGGRQARSAVVYGGIDPAPFLAGEDDTREALRLGLKLGEKPLVGLFGRITSWKGQHILFRALAELPDVHAIIVGDVLFGEVAYREELEVLARELNISDRVHWLGMRRDIPALMKAVDIVVHTSTAPEPFGRVIVEGMLSARPVLATDHGASRELLGNNPLALVPPGDAARLAEAIQAILKMPEHKRAQQGDLNKARAQSLFCLPAMLTSLAQEIGFGPTMA